jgi:hypothetical protein
VAIDYLQGLVLAALLGLGAMYLSPTGIGPHLTLPLYAAVFAWEWRTVFWRYTVPSLFAYSVAVPWWLGGGADLLPWAIASLLAALLVRFLSSAPPTSETSASVELEVEASPLGLVDERGARGDGGSEPSSPPRTDSQPRKKREPPPGLLDW